MDDRKISIDETIHAAFSSIFGWILIGPLSGYEADPFLLLPVLLTVSVKGSMERFWQVVYVYAYRQVTMRYRCRFVHRFSPKRSLGNAR